MENMERWNAVAKPPKEALKTIAGGRLQGMTDINPQWRYKVMTEIYGQCGIGWKYEPKRLWFEKGSDNQVVAFAEIELFIRDGDKWSDPIPGNGGSMFISNEKNGLRTSDEAFKMATTDALSVAMKMLGVGSEVYEGRFDGSKYREDTQETHTSHQTQGNTPTSHSVVQPPKASAPAPMSDKQRQELGLITSQQVNPLLAAIKKVGIDQIHWKVWLNAAYGIPSVSAIRAEMYDGILATVTSNPETIKNFKI